MTDNIKYRVGDTVVFKKPFWWYGKDIGGSTGVIKKINSYIFVKIPDTPTLIKCFDDEIYMQFRPSIDQSDDMDEILKKLNDLFD